MGSDQSSYCTSPMTSMTPHQPSREIASLSGGLMRPSHSLILLPNYRFIPLHRGAYTLTAPSQSHPHAQPHNHLFTSCGIIHWPAGLASSVSVLSPSPLPSPCSQTFPRAKQTHSDERGTHSLGALGRLGGMNVKRARSVVKRKFIQLKRKSKCSTDSLMSLLCMGGLIQDIF